MKRPQVNREGMRGLRVLQDDISSMCGESGFIRSFYYWKEPLAA